MGACFVGDDYSRPLRLDSDYLIEMEPYVRHYDLYAATPPDHSKPQVNNPLLACRRLITMTGNYSIHTRS